MLNQRVLNYLQRDRHSRGLQYDPAPRPPPSTLSRQQFDSLSQSYWFMYKLYRHKLYQHNLYRHKLYRHKLYREHIVSGTNCIGNKLFREQTVSGTYCIGNKLYRQVQVSKELAARLQQGEVLTLRSLSTYIVFLISLLPSYLLYCTYVLMPIRIRIRISMLNSDWLQNDADHV
jgi:hypothetical protein